MESEKGRAVIDFWQHDPGEQKGSTYKLNFIEVLVKALEDLANENDFSVYNKIRLIWFSQYSKNLEHIEANNVYKRFIELAEKHLSDLPLEPKIFRSPAGEASKKRIEDNSK